MNRNRIWYADKNDFSTQENVHQILMFGTLDEIKSLKKVVGEKDVREAFLCHPKKIYTAPALNLIKNFVLHITISVDEQKYLKDTPRNIR